MIDPQINFSLNYSFENTFCSLIREKKLFNTCWVWNVQQICFFFVLRTIDSPSVQSVFGNVLLKMQPHPNPLSTLINLFAHTHFHTLIQMLAGLTKIVHIILFVCFWFFFSSSIFFFFSLQIQIVRKFSQSI